MADAPSGPTGTAICLSGEKFSKGNRTGKVSRAYLAPQSQSHCGVCCYATKIGRTPAYCDRRNMIRSKSHWHELKGILKSPCFYRESAGRMDKTGHEARATTFCVTLPTSI